MTDTPHSAPGPIDAEQVDPEHASSERAAETPPQEDAERMESALREGGPLGSREADSAEPPPFAEDGPGTSLT